MHTVLLVEDEPLIALMVEDALQDAGYSVKTAHTACEAYELLMPEPRSFSVLLTDINLGDGDDGFCVARRARELNPSVQVAYMTGQPENFHAVAPGRALLFTKPFHPDDLVRELGLRIGT